MPVGQTWFCTGSSMPMLRRRAGRLMELLLSITWRDADKSVLGLPEKGRGGGGVGEACEPGCSSRLFRECAGGHVGQVCSEWQGSSPGVVSSEKTTEFSLWQTQVKC